MYTTEYTQRNLLVEPQASCATYVSSSHALVFACTPDKFQSSYLQLIHSRSRSEGSPYTGPGCSRHMLTYISNWKISLLVDFADWVQALPVDRYDPEALTDSDSHVHFWIVLTLKT